jgi:uncharacterized protein (DUF2147 family)
MAPEHWGDDTMIRTAIYGLALTALLAGPAAHAAIKGHWVNPSKSVIIDIAPCAHSLCGTVSWASEKAKQDSLKGTKHLVGSHLLTGLQKKSHDHWKGKIFVPDQNMHVSAKLTLLSSGHMKVAGCAVMGTICKSQVWVRTHHTHF